MEFTKADWKTADEGCKRGCEGWKIEEDKKIEKTEKDRKTAKDRKSSKRQQR